MKMMREDQAMKLTRSKVLMKAVKIAMKTNMRPTKKNTRMRASSLLLLVASVC